MNHRERVLAAIEHREPDRVPIDLGSTPSSSISAVAYSNLIQYLGWDEPTKVVDVVQQAVQPSEAILDRYDVGVVDLGRVFNDTPGYWDSYTLSTGAEALKPAWFQPIRTESGNYECYDEDGLRLAMMPVGATFFDQTYFPYLEDYPETFADLDHAMSKVHWATYAQSPWDLADDPNFWTNLRAKAIELRASTDRAIMITAGCNLFEWGTFLRRIDNFLVDLLLEPEKVAELLDQLLERHLANLAKICESVGDVVDLIRFGDDLGTDTGPFMNPDTYRELFKPRHAQLCDFVHQHSTMHTFLHSCGSIEKVLPDLIEAGIEVINPVQTSARDMEAERLKRDFGADITFWGGGCDTRRVLNHGKPQEVRDHVRQNLETFAPGGGFVFNTVHNIMPDVPPQNIEAMFEAVEQYG